MGDLRIEPVTPAHLDDLDRLFTSGDPRTCQCAYVRLTNAAYTAATVDERREVRDRAIREAHAEGRAAGLVASRDDDIVGWVSFDRRETYDRLSASRLLAPVDDRPVVAVVCFVVAKQARRSGVAQALLDATVRHAREQGITLLESYPVAASGPTSSAALWRGTVSMFEQAGFTTVEVRRQHAGAAPRPIMRRPVRRRSVRGPARPASS